MHRASLLALLTRYAEANAEERAVARRFAALFEARPDCFERSGLSGHATASAFIVSADLRAFLLTHHRKLGKWLQLGVPLDIDIHAIPARAGEPDHEPLRRPLPLAGGGRSGARDEPRVHRPRLVPDGGRAGDRGAREPRPSLAQGPELARYDLMRAIPLRLKGRAALEIRKPTTLIAPAGHLRSKEKLKKTSS